MAGKKRTDNKGRILRDNEHQRKDGKYEYKYFAGGQRKTVYSWRLVPSDRTPKGKRDDLSLREKEKEIDEQIPKPEIHSQVLEDESIQTLDEKDGLFNKLKIEDIRTFDANSKDAMEKRAIENGLLDKALENAKAIIYKLIDNDIVKELEYDIMFEVIEE